MTDTYSYSLTLAQVNAIVTQAQALAGVGVPWESRLWDADDIADYLKVSRRTVAESYAIQPNFPVALRPGGGYPRWLASEIVEWAESCRPRKNNRSKS